MADYIQPDLLRCKPLTSDRDDALVDTWQPAGLIARRLVRRLGIPLPTAKLFAEVAGFPAEPI